MPGRLTSLRAPRRPGKQRYPPAVIGLQDVEDARRRVTPVLRATPVTVSDSLSHVAGRQVLLKPEHLQRTGSFKVRGAYNFISQLPAGEAVVAASAGNHAQGVALAGSLTAHPATIFMPASATLPKVVATRGYGATVRLEGDGIEECIGGARAFAEANGAVFVPPFDDPLVVAGQGTVGLEVAEQAPAGAGELGYVVVPVGGGGLIAGVATALAHTRRGVRVIGVEAAGADSMLQSVRAKQPVSLERVATMADGIAVRAPSELTLAHVLAYVDDIVTVTEEETSHALLLLLERAKAVVEPAGAVALAAILAGKIPGREPALAVLSGGNVDPLLLIKLIEHGLSAAGRYLVLRIVVDDRPGSLAALTDSVARLGLNVLSVEHHRAGARVGVDEVEVVVTVETRDPEHRDAVVTALSQAGFAVELVG